jgi:hypothetical protein
MDIRDAADPVSFTAALERDKDGTWWYLHVPAEIRSAWRHVERRGHIRVDAVVGGSRWTGSLMPWADGSAQLTVGKAVRTAEGLALGDPVTVTLWPVPADPRPGS